MASSGPERYLCWRWEDPSEENRVTYQPDSKKPNAATFILHKEDHTLGNLIRIQLLRDNSVRFAAYRMPHPLIFDTHIRVETMDSKKTPISVRHILFLYFVFYDHCRFFLQASRTYKWKQKCLNFNSKMP
jgi:DNA-directed RNA polymerase II subunit RPB11